MLFLLKALPSPQRRSAPLTARVAAGWHHQTLPGMSPALRVFVLLTPWEGEGGTYGLVGGRGAPTPATQGGGEVLDEPKERAGSGKEPRTGVE